MTDPSGTVFRPARTGINSALFATSTSSITITVGGGIAIPDRRGRIDPTKALKTGLLAGLATIAAVCATADCSIRDNADAPPRLYRFGLGSESAEKLGADAAAAVAIGFPHGVSTFSRSNRPDAASAPRSQVEEFFRVVKTGRSPFHYTVVLPRPVTTETADTFNRLFGRLGPTA
jgi:hypothetical protein